MAEVKTVTCDCLCGETITVSNYTHPDGWVTAHGGNPYRNRQFAGWEHLYRFSLNKLQVVAGTAVAIT